MANRERELRVRLIGDSSGAEKAFDRVDGKSQQLESRFGKTAGIAKNLFSGAVIGSAVSGLASFIGGGLKAIAEMDRLTKATEAVIRSTGGAAGVSAEQVAKYADAIEKMSGIEAEGVIEAENLLLTFSNIGGAGGMFERTTKAAVDMSVAFGSTAKDAALQLGKALNSPVEGVSALSRVGVTFTEDQKKLIEGFVAVGHIAAAQDVILDELEKQVGGAAKAYGESLPGEIDKAKNKIGEFQEQLAGELIPFMANTVVPGLEAMWTAFDPTDEHLSSFERGIDRIVIALERVIEKTRRGHREWVAFMDDIGDNEGLLDKFFSGVSGAVTGNNAARPSSDSAPTGDPANAQPESFDDSRGSSGPGSAVTQPSSSKVVAQGVNVNIETVNMTEAMDPQQFMEDLGAVIQMHTRIG